MPFFPSNNQQPSPDPFSVLQQPVCSLFQIPPTPIHHLVYHPISVRCPALLCYSLCLPYTENERNGGQGRRAGRPERRIELVGMTSWYSFSDGEGPTRNGGYVRRVFHVLKPTPPLPNHPSVSATLSARMTMALGSITPAAPTKGDSTPKNCIGSIEKWCARRRRGYWCVSPFLFLSSHFITHRSIQSPNHSSRMLSTAPRIQKSP